MYAVWDHFPIITAENRTVTAEQAEKGFLTESELLRTAQADDREDGKLEKGSALRVLDYHMEDFLNLGKNGWCTVTYEARDSVGNTSYHMIRVDVTDNRTEEKPEYVRFIDQDNYAKENSDSGALYPDSVWYEDGEYVQILKKALQKISAQEQGKILYEFSAADIQISKNYVKRTGIGNSTDDTGLSQWLQLFSTLRKK